MKICPACGVENKDRNNFCNKCGTRLDIAKIFPDFNTPESEKQYFPADQQPLEHKEAVVFSDQLAFENEETVVFDEQQDYENEETVVLDEQQDHESEETAVLEEQTSDNEDTAEIVTPYDQQFFGEQPSFGNEEATEDETPAEQLEAPANQLEALAEQQAFVDEETEVFDNPQIPDNEDTVEIVTPYDQQTFRAQPSFGNEEATEAEAPAEQLEAPVDQFETPAEQQIFDYENTVIINDRKEEPPQAPNYRYERDVHRDPQNDVENEMAYIDHLRRLKGLLDDGIITRWEFEQKKRQILGLDYEHREQ